MRFCLGAALVSVLISASSTASAQNFSVKAEVRGGTIKKLAGEAAGLPVSALPGVQLVSSKAFFAKYKQRDQTPSGLFVLDADFIPPTLPDLLKRDGLTLMKDGTLLTADKQKETMLVLSPASFAVQIGEQGRHDGGPLRNFFWLVPEAHAAAPFPLSNVTAMATWRTPTGFCRTVTAKTESDAWGSGAPTPSWYHRPHTRIEGIETRAFIEPNGDTDTCLNCDRQSSTKRWRAGCFWPAYSASGFHYVAFKDGPFQFAWSFEW
jgi:hypothetical protein